MGWKVFFSFILLLLLLFTPQDELSGNNKVLTVEARMCLAQSRGFQGTCLSSPYCEQVCRSEGFNDGRCRGLIRQCFCSWPCA
ncbi:hypothetical protein CDL12_27916 [Handroanthus impetiginosus]|uniref:Knottins-like domain-containing protein n=1 Tax=Handroanthus impetiginosus TaxID=429701 RepID=A0A2G9G2P9_9LAMI|nr:hypothetical protein CDL12_27916 [Handroanthus impetiginosus]